MPLEFVNDAICLSGVTGSKLKCAVIGDYYPFWWSITSGGKASNYEYPTGIVELDAATGEVYIQDANETVLGSSGHALDLKCSNPDTRNLKVVLVEKDKDCYARLKSVIRRRWNKIDVGLAEGPLHKNSSNIYLVNKDLDHALDDIAKIQLGNSLFFFDPLRSVEYAAIEKVASKRISSFYKTGTEFIIFLFTSDWFLGRGDFAALPKTTSQGNWSSAEKATVSEADALFGDTRWRDQVLTTQSIPQREENLVACYRNSLHKWFRYVLFMPFNPKEDQLFHIILCSNFATGVRATRNFYCEKTGNPKYSPDNKAALAQFRSRHPDVFVGLRGPSRPLQWRILWKTITDHEDGICDSLCGDFDQIEADSQKRQQLLEWLEKNGYLGRFVPASAWNVPIKQYKVNWATLKRELAIDSPVSLRPLPYKEARQ